MFLEDDSNGILSDSCRKSIVDDDQHQVIIHCLYLSNCIGKEEARASDESVTIIIEVCDSCYIICSCCSGWSEICAFQSKLISSLLDTFEGSLVE